MQFKQSELRLAENFDNFFNRRGPSKYRIKHWSYSTYSGGIGGYNLERRRFIPVFWKDIGFAEFDHIWECLPFGPENCPKDVELVVTVPDEYDSFIRACNPILQKYEILFGSRITVENRHIIRMADLESS